MMKAITLLKVNGLFLSAMIKKRTVIVSIDLLDSKAQLSLKLVAPNRKTEERFKK